MKTSNVSQSLASLLLLAGTYVLSVSPSSAAVPDLAGTIKVDGSSTVYPITEAVAEEFGRAHSKTKVTVGISGTGGGFKKFCAGETDISDASRPIKSSEVEACMKNGVAFIELPVAYDALTVVVHPSNTWATSITTAELKKIWQPEAQGKVMTWNQIRPEWPNKPLALFGAGSDSGTFDYFTEAIVGKEDASRGDFTASEDDNVLVQGVSANPGALGFFGLAYFEENRGRLKALPIDDGNDANGKGAQLPTRENVEKSVYQPLARPLFIYVRRDAVSRPEVKEFVSFYLQNAENLTTEVGYIPLQKGVYQLARTRFDAGKTGSLFAKGAQVGMTLEQLMQRESA